MKRKITLAMASLAVTFLMSASSVFAATPNWNVSGDWDIAVGYGTMTYPHDLKLMQTNDGTLTGSGGYPANSVHTNEWSITSGNVSGNDITFSADYTKGTGALNPLTTLNVQGTINSSGTMSGTWSNNYQGQPRNGIWTSSAGMATAINTNNSTGNLSAEDFGVVNYDTGMGILKGYSAGFGLSNATLAGATSVVVKLYGANSTLLQTNTAIMSKFNTNATGTQFSSPFDVAGSFNYVTDGYWTNVRSTEHGQSVPATKVVAKVTLANGQMVTAENTSLSGDPTILYSNGGGIGGNAPILSGVPTEVTIPELSLYHFYATASNTSANASNTNDNNFTFSLKNAPLGAMINATSGVFSWTPTEVQGPVTYTFNVIVSNGSQTDSKQIMINVTKVSSSNGDHPKTIQQCKDKGWQQYNNPDFKNQGQCINYVYQQDNNDNNNNDLQYYLQLIDLLKKILMQFHFGNN